MVDTQKRNTRQNAWQKENVDRINFVMPKGYKAVINETAKRMDITASEFIRGAINDRLQQNGVDITNIPGLHSDTDVIK